MSYECNDSSCRPCKHVELEVMCPNCLNHKLVVAPAGKWVSCPDWHRCEWEMSFEDYLKSDIEGERQATIQRSLEQYRQEIEIKQAQMAIIEAKV